MSGQLQISIDALRMAHHYVQFCHSCYEFFAREMGKDGFAKLQDRIQQCLDRNGRTSYSELLNRLSKHGECKAPEFKKALLQMEERSLINRPPNLHAKYADVELKHRNPDKR